MMVETSNEAKIDHFPTEAYRKLPTKMVAGFCILSSIYNRHNNSIVLKKAI
jgi:hypothetical protein